MSGSRFEFLRQQRGEKPAESTPTEAPPEAEHNGQSSLAEAEATHSPAPPEKPAKRRRAETAPAAAASEKKRGRPPGKRSHDGFTQVTAYIRRDVHYEVKLALLRENKGQEFSELVDELLFKWLKSRS